MSAGRISIREAGPQDAAAILPLYAQPDYDNGRVLDEAAALSILQKCDSYPFYKFFIAEDNGSASGVYALLIMDNLGHMGSPSAIVEGVAVAPKSQGKGIGTAMMRHAMEEAVKQGCYKIALSSNIKRRRAHEFYARLGFTQHGVSFSIALNGAARKQS